MVTHYTSILNSYGAHNIFCTQRGCVLWIKRTSINVNVMPMYLFTHYNLSQLFCLPTYIVISYYN